LNKFPASKLTLNSILPLVFVLGTSAIKAAVEDYVHFTIHLIDSLTAFIHSTDM
jgi:hypothetical protein